MQCTNTEVLVGVWVFPRLALVVCFVGCNSQDPETMADLEHFLTPGLFDDTRQVSEILQSFFSFESEMQKIQKRHTHHFKDDRPRMMTRRET